MPFGTDKGLFLKAWLPSTRAHIYMYIFCAFVPLVYNSFIYQSYYGYIYGHIGAQMGTFSSNALTIKWGNALFTRAHV